MPMGTKLWSYSTGIRGLSRVRVYERIPGGPIHVEFSGGKRQTLTNLADIPITDRKIAKKVANRLSEKLEAKGQKQVAREVLGLAEHRTLEELLNRYHRDVGGTWGASHARHQEHLRQWWLRELGAGSIIYEITEADVERRVRARKDWAPRTRQKYLRYIMAVFKYAQRKLRWVQERHNLQGVDVPKPDRGGPSYSHPEILQLLRTAPGVDIRYSAALEVAYDTQARSKALLHLRVEDYLGAGMLTFRAMYDKAGKDRVAVLSPSARRRLEAVIGDRAEGWIFQTDGRRMTYDELLRGLRAVETAAGIPHVKGRGWHAVKRRAVTDARRAVGDMGAVARQSGTLASTLERIYEQDDMEPKQAVADAMEQLRGAG